MGADFLYTYLPCIEITPARLETLRAIASVLTLADFEDEDVEDDLEAAREVILAAVDWLAGAARDREVGVFRHSGMPYPLWLTGGMSWGDAPTDAAAWMEILANCPPVSRQIEAWALEDQRERDSRAAE
jgi:hypothetical protein